MRSLNPLRRQRALGRSHPLRGNRDALPETQSARLPAPTLPHELRLDLSRAIAALPPAWREVLILRDVDELTGPEVAARLGLSIEVVKSRLHRARQQLRAGLLASGYWDMGAGHSGQRVGASGGARTSADVEPGHVEPAHVEAVQVDSVHVEPGQVAPACAEQGPRAATSRSGRPVL